MPPSQLIQVEVLLELDAKQQCLKVPGLKLIPVNSQAVVQLLDVLGKVTEELQCEESMEEANLMEKVH